jgi:hypothetical protein
MAHALNIYDGCRYRYGSCIWKEAQSQVRIFEEL